MAKGSHTSKRDYQAIEENYEASNEDSNSSTASPGNATREELDILFKYLKHGIIVSINDVKFIQKKGESFSVVAKVRLDIQGSAYFTEIPLKFSRHSALKLAQDLARQKDED